MLLATAIVMHRALSFDKSRAWSSRLGYGLSGVLVLVAVVHCYLDESLLHQGTFAVMVVVTGRRTVKLIDERVKGADAKGRMRGLARAGLGMCFIYYCYQSVRYFLCR